LSGLALTIGLVVIARMGLLGVYIGSACTNVISFCVAMAMIHRSLRPAFSLSRLRALLAYGVPLVPITVAGWAIALSSRFFIQAHTGGSDVGIFGMGSKVAQIMMLFVTAFTLAWGPFAFSIAEERDARRTYAKVLTFYTAGMGWLALGLSLFAPLILLVAVNPSFARAYQVVPPLALAYMVAGAYNIVAVGTSLSKKTIHLSWTTIAAAVVTVVLNAVLLPLPYMSLVGGALATLAGQLVSVGLVYWVSQRLYPVPYERGKVLRCVAIIGLLVIVGQLERIWVEPNLAVGILVRLLLLGLYPLLLIGLRVIERYEVVVLREGVRTWLETWSQPA
jgi:O-antigen/teichoic acid export membrane protein